MQYLITFIEGILTFISPCLLPMLPVYLSYFAGQNDSEPNDRGQRHVLKNALAFILGFSIVFVLLGAFAGSLGSFLTRYKTAVNWFTGGMMVLFGLNFIGVLRIGFLNRPRGASLQTNKTRFASTVLFGIIFSIGWTPCVGAFLGSALMLAASEGDTFKGVLMLISYSAGLGVPFVASALLMDQLKNTLDFIKKHYKLVQILSGSLLILFGLMTAFGWMDVLLGLMSF